MPKKIMLWPSARSKFVKDKNMQLIYYSLLVLAAVMVLNNYYMHGFMYGLKLALMIVVSIILTVEMEILFYTHDKDITRQESKELIKKSYPKVTAMIYVLLIPIGTPLWLVGVGAVLATLLGKLLFGGYAHMVFHTSLVGVIFVTLGWEQIVDSVAFQTSFDNYLIDLIFNTPFFRDTLSLGSYYDPQTMTSALGMLTNGEMYPMLDVFLGITPGIIGNGILLIIIAAFLLFKKAINWVTPTVLLVTFLLVAFIFGLVNGEDPLYPFYHLFTGALLFVTVFVVTDPITTPIPLKGKIVFGVVAGALTFFIRNGVKYEEGIIFAVLFMMMLTPMLNQVFKEKKPVKKPAPKKVGV